MGNLIKIGKVVSAKTPRTIVVEVIEPRPHPLYKKMMRKRKKFMADCDKQPAVGSLVKIIQTRPLSARKRWKLMEVIKDHGSA